MTMALPCHAALFRRSLGGGDEALRQALAVGLPQLHEPLLLVAEQVMAEAGAELGELLVDLRHPRLGLFGEAGAGTVEAGVGALQQAELLRRKTKTGAVLVQMGDAAKQHGVHHDRIPVPRHPQGDLLVDLQDGRVGMRRDEVVEDRRDLGEELAGALQRRDGVGEVGGRRIVGDRRDLGGVVGEGLLEGRQKVLGLDLVEGRGRKRRHPGLQQRVGLGVRGLAGV